jgi:hypothetical protein
MPLCPQVTITPITVTSTGMTQTSVIAAADPATTEQLTTVNTSAAAAQADATEALADALVAYNAAIGSLQPSANTIVNASNQMTAINSGGITVYSGAAATSGPRVVLNSAGLAGFKTVDGTDIATFSISASTGAAVFSGNVTGATITGGTLNIAGKAIIDSAGLLTATGATITGTITSTSGNIGGFNVGTTYLSSGAGGTGFFINSSTGAGSFGSLSASGTVLAKAGLVLQTDTCTVSAGGNTFNNVGTFGASAVNVSQTISIAGGYGIDSDWAPQTDNTYNLGQATSAGYFENRRWQRLYSNNTTISTSDVNAKTDVANSALGLDFVNSLRPISYRWIVGHREVVKDAEGNPVIVGEDPMGKPIYELQDVPGVRLHYGFIAQEVKQAVDASGVEDFAGWVQDDLSNPDSTQSLSYEQFIAPMAKAIQELSARVQQLEGA